ncbi:unnamed protein product [Caenorhabditis auriculariae]|uniref:Uncharacterized protein n=1 Tax=Caenorhabditis auriculariae TaxID=2777116 RepID=A0A8S1H0K9_9PELO|nr:unnamed protein product [Caenorhabditis auriculariae]
MPRARVSRGQNAGETSRRKNPQRARANGKKNVKETPKRKAPQRPRANARQNVAVREPSRPDVPQPAPVNRGPYENRRVSTPRWLPYRARLNPIQGVIVEPQDLILPRCPLQRRGIKIRAEAVRILIGAVYKIHLLRKEYLTLPVSCRNFETTDYFERYMSPMYEDLTEETRQYPLPHLIDPDHPDSDESSGEEDEEYQVFEEEKDEDEEDRPYYRDEDNEETEDEADYDDSD